MTKRRQRQHEPSHRSQRILSFKAWCELNSISEATGRRLIKAGKVRVTRLSERRIGIGEDDNAAYQGACAQADRRRSEAV
jgi:predicted site-specific integrase-resolvase